MNQNELLYLCRLNNEKAFIELWNEVQPIVTAVFYDYIREGKIIDKDEVMQCARIGLINAIDYYREDKGMAFNSFASLCIKREVKRGIKLMRRIERYKNKQIISIDYALKEHDGLYIVDMMADNNDYETERLALQELMLDEIEKKLGKESKEYQVIKLRIDGYKYKEICDILHMSTKSVEYYLKKARDILSYIKEDM